MRIVRKEPSGACLDGEPPGAVAQSSPEFDARTGLRIAPVVAQRQLRGRRKHRAFTQRETSLVYEDGMHRYEVAFFNPGSNVVKRSVLRLVNPGDADAEVTITAVDDDGAEAPESDVTLTVPAGEARDLSALALESGGDDFEGSFGDGEGKWRLTVSADRALLALRLVMSRYGYLGS